MHIFETTNLVCKKFYRLALISLFLLMHACGTQEDTTDVTTTVNTNVSSLLTDNPLASAKDFNNFQNKTIAIDPSALPLSGNRLFLKLYRDNNDIIFLGEIDRFSLFSIEINILLDVESLNYEIFSNDNSDIAQFGMITL